MKQPLHRKKLQLALQALLSGEEDLRGKLDHNWVTSECGASSSTFTLTSSLTALLLRVAGRHRAPAVQEQLRGGASGRTRAALHDGGELLRSRRRRWSGLLLLTALFSGGPAVSEGGERPSSPEHQESHPGPPPELLPAQLSAEATFRRGLTPQRLT